MTSGNRCLLCCLMPYFFQILRFQGAEFYTDHKIAYRRRGGVVAYYTEGVACLLVVPVANRRRAGLQFSHSRRHRGELEGRALCFSSTC